MKLLKADNYQTWYIEKNNESILIDPWLTNQLQPDGSLFIQRNKLNVSCLSDKDIDKVHPIEIKLRSYTIRREDGISNQ